MQRIANNQNFLQGVRIRHLFCVDEIFESCVGALLDKNVVSPGAVLNRISARRTSFSGFVTIPLAASKNDLSYLSLAVKVEGMVYSFPKDRRNLIAPHGCSQNYGSVCLDICFAVTECINPGGKQT